MLDNYEFLLRKREEFANEPIIPPPLVRGDDLIALGLKPGPKFGEILEAVETRQLESKLHRREEGLEWVKREYLTGKPITKTSNALHQTSNENFNDQRGGTAVAAFGCAGGCHGRIAERVACAWTRSKRS